MKNKNLISIAISLILTCGFYLVTEAQQISRTENLDLRPLLFKDFLRANIYMKDGSLIAASINYNTNDQTIIYVDNGNYMELTGVDEIDEIKIGDDVFIPIKGKVYQKTERDDIVISFSNKVGVNEITTTKAESGKRDSRITSNSVSNIYLNQNYKSPNELIYVKRFWLIKNGKFIEMSNSKKLADTFNMSKKDLNDFVKRNNINFHFYPDIVKLLNFLDDKIDF